MAILTHGVSWIDHQHLSILTLLQIYIHHIICEKASTASPLTNISKFRTFKCKLVVICLESNVHRAIYKHVLMKSLPYIYLN